ncbi:hypothetical protein EJB05_51919, partial [Eragrostis curvula]
MRTVEAFNEVLGYLRLSSWHDGYIVNKRMLRSGFMFASFSLVTSSDNSPADMNYSYNNSAVYVQAYCGSCQLPWRAPVPWHRAENESVSRTVISAKCMSSWLTYAAHLCGINSSIIRPLKTRLVTFRAESSCPAKANNKEVLPEPGGPNSNVNLQLRVVR